MHYTVHRSLFSGRSGSLERSCRVVHPHIDTLYEIFCKSDVIVWNKDNFSDEFRSLGNVHNHLDEVLSGLVCRVSLSSEHKLYRTARIVDNLIEPVKVTEKQVSPLVGGKTPCETDCKDIVTESLLDGDNLARRIVVCL